MINKYSQHFSSKQTDQSEKIPGKEHLMEQNNAGGISFKLDNMDRLRRFLILGSDCNTYYQSARKLTIENANCVKECLDQNYKTTIDIIVDISNNGRAPKNDAALFALAIAASHKSVEARQYALANLHKVARIGTHLFQFADMVQHLRGWGRSLRKAVADWYLKKDNKHLSLQIVKYQQREGWSHRDLLRLSHPETHDDVKQAILRYAVKGREKELTSIESVPEDLRIVWAFETAKNSTDLNEVIDLVNKYNLPHECVPNDLKKNPELWHALLQNMPMTAMIRNLSRMTSIGLLKPGSEDTKLVVERLQNQELLMKARIHPFNALIAQLTYKQGKGVKGSLTWNPVKTIVDALEKAFYLSFKTVTPSNKPTLLGLDVSGSMDCGSYGMNNLNNIPGMTPRIACACMAMVTARTEPDYDMVAFSHKLVKCDIQSTDSLATVVQKMQRIPMGGTDCALPMLYAAEQNLKFHNFAIYTDNETWFGSIHPCQALQKVRTKLGVPAKLAVVGITATDFSIADPEDKGMLDLVGMDSATPQIMSDFFNQEL